MSISKNTKIVSHVVRTGNLNIYVYIIKWHLFPFHQSQLNIDQTVYFVIQIVTNMKLFFYVFTSLSLFLSKLNHPIDLKTDTYVYE